MAILILQKFVYLLYACQNYTDN